MNQIEGEMMAQDVGSRIAVLKGRRSETNKKMVGWSVVLGGSMFICLGIASYFENHLTFEEAYLNQSSKRADIAYGFGIAFMVAWIVVVLIIASKRVTIDKELAEIDRIRTSTQQAELIGAAVRKLETSPLASQESTPSKVEQLERIAKLRNDGVISEAEFNRLKDELI